MNNLSGFNLFAQLRNRFKAVLGSFTAAISVFACGAVMTFVLAPNQAILAYKVSRMPIMTAQSVDSGRRRHPHHWLLDRRCANSISA